MVNAPVYKIGRTDNLLVRMKAYPKGSLIIEVRRVREVIQAEKELIDAFKRRFKQRLDVGREYFEGPYEQVQQLFADVSRIVQGSSVKSVKIISVTLKLQFH